MMKVITYITCTLKAERLESQIILKVLGASKPKGLSITYKTNSVTSSSPFF
jgi:hypothetical protein